MTKEHKPKMAPQKDAPPGLEQDSLGNPIPFEERTEDDKEKVIENLAGKMHGGASIKNPEGEAENPAPMPKADQRPSSGKPYPHDPEGQQGSTPKRL